MASAFRPGLAVSLRPPSTNLFMGWLHPPASFAPPPEFHDTRSALRAPGEPCDLPVDRRAPPMGFDSSSRHQPAASTPARDPTPELTFRPRRFSRPRRLAPPPALRVCFTPLPRPGFALQGFVPLRGAVPAFTGRVMPSCRRAEPPAGLTRRQRSRPRLQGLAPRGECGVDQCRLKPRPIRAPLGLLLLRVLSPRTMGAPSRPLRPQS